MYAAYPVYIPSNRYAEENGEIDLWRESYKINKECRDFINEKGAPAYYDRTFPEFIKELTDIFGLERAMFVMGRIIVSADWDRRYDGDVKMRAEQFNYCDMKEGNALYEAGQDPYRTADWTRDLYSNVHPCILNDIFRSLMKMERDNHYLPADDNSPDKEHDEGVEM